MEADAAGICEKTHPLYIVLAVDPLALFAPVRVFTGLLGAAVGVEGAVIAVFDGLAVLQ